MNTDHEESVEYLRAQLRDLLELADRLDLFLVGVRLSSAIDAIPGER